MKHILSTVLLAALSTLSTLAASFTYTWHQDAYVWAPGVTHTPPTAGSFTVDAMWIPYGEIWSGDIDSIRFSIPGGANYAGASGGFWQVDPVTGQPIAGSIRLAPNYNGGPYFSGASIEPGSFTLAHPLVAGSITGHWAVTYIP